MELKTICNFYNTITQKSTKQFKKSQKLWHLLDNHILILQTLFYRNNQSYLKIQYTFSSSLHATVRLHKTLVSGMWLVPKADNSEPAPLTHLCKGIRILWYQHGLLTRSRANLYFSGAICVHPNWAN